jgi:hypothetical protein
MHPTLALVFALGHAFALTHAGQRNDAAPARAAGGSSTPAPADGQSAGPTIDLRGLEPLDPQMRADLEQAIARKCAPVIARYTVPAAKIRVTIAWHDVATFDYALVLEIAPHDGRPAQEDRRSTGKDSEQSELGDMVEAALERQLDEWTRAREQALAATPPPPAVTPTTVAPPERADTGRPLGAMGWVGLGSLVAGAAGLGVGVGLLLREPTPHPTDETKLRSWKPGGIGFAVAGGVALVAGAALVGIDARRHAKRRRTTALAPWAGRGTAGLSFAAAF